MLLGASLAVGCGSSDGDASKPKAGTDAGSDADAAPPSFASQKYGDFEPWASPIDDYIAGAAAHLPFHRAPEALVQADDGDEPSSFGQAVGSDEPDRGGPTA